MREKKKIKFFNLFLYSSSHAIDTFIKEKRPIPCNKEWKKKFRGDKWEIKMEWKKKRRHTRRKRIKNVLHRERLLCGGIEIKLSFHWDKLCKQIIVKKRIKQQKNWNFFALCDFSSPKMREKNVKLSTEKTAL